MRSKIQPRLKFSCNGIKSIGLESPLPCGNWIKAMTDDYIKEGKSTRELAAKYKINRKTVALQLKKAGVTLRLPQCNVWTGPLSEA
jgi:hypothetical protein